MAEEQEDLNLGTDEGQEINKVEKRIKDLSEKVKLTAQERDEKDKLLKERDDKLTATEKERDFFKGFSNMASKYNAASEFQDKIKDKVMAGYDVEDATVAVLSREGRLNNQAPSPPQESPAGGSATTNLKSGSEKTIDEMTQAERRSALEQAERESGDLTKIFRAGY